MQTPLDVDAVTLASTRSIAGYVSNAARRAGAPRAPAQGGRGTKRHREAVTSVPIQRLDASASSSSHVKQEAKFDATCIDVDAVCAPEAAPPPSTVQSALSIQVTAVVTEDDGAEWDRIDITGWDTTTPAADAEVVKRGADVKDMKDGRTGVTAKVESSADNVVAGVEPTRSSALQAAIRLETDDSAAAYDADIAMARKYALKNITFSRSVGNFLAYTVHGTVLRRAAVNPRLTKWLVRRSELANNMIRWRADAESAVKADDPTGSANLQPAWITAKKNGAKDSPVCSIAHQIIQKLHDLFQPPPGAGGGAGGGGGGGGGGAVAAEPPSPITSVVVKQEAAPSSSSPLLGGRAPGSLSNTTGRISWRHLLRLLKQCHRPSAPIGPRKAAAKTQAAAAAGPKVVLPSRDLHIALLCLSSLKAAGLPGCRLCVAFRAREYAKPLPPHVAQRIMTDADAARVISTLVEEDAGDDNPAVSPARRPSASWTGYDQNVSRYWCEIYCPRRQCFLSVSPCFPGVATAWNFPYVLAFGGDHVVDVTARYVAAWTQVHFKRLDEMHYSPGLLWDVDVMAPPLSATDVALLPFRCQSPIPFQGALLRSHQEAAGNLRCELNATQRLLSHICRDVTIEAATMLMRESRQLASLVYSEPIPTTLTAAKKHPLYVPEDGLGRYESIYPRDSSTLCGFIRSKPVFLRAAVNNLRSREGWLRVGRVVLESAEPYKLAQPPASRPLHQPSRLFGYWQTVAFEPLAPDPSSQDIPRHTTHGNWYMLLGRQLPAGLTLLRQPHMSLVARKTHTDFAFCVQGFRQDKSLAGRGRGHGAWLSRGGRWVPIFDGIVVSQGREALLLRAYQEWKGLKDQREAQAVRTRALRWWRVFISLMIARERVNRQYGGDPTSSSAAPEHQSTTVTRTISSRARMVGQRRTRSP